MTMGAGVDYDIGYHAGLSDKGHPLQLALVALSSMLYAAYVRGIAPSVLRWVIEMGLGAGAAFVPDKQDMCSG